MFMNLQAEPAWFSVVGLAIDILAVILLAWDLLIKRSLSQRPVSNGDAASSVWRRFLEAKMTVICILLLVIGFGLQIFGNWPR